MSEPDIVTLARGDLAVWTFGEGPPVLVLHGFPDHAIGMRSLAEAVAAAGFRAIVPALPGYAPSAVPADGDLSMTAVARDMTGLLDHVGIDRAHVVGHDWGGILGYRMGAEQAGRIASLTALAVCHDAGFNVRRTVLREQQTGAYAWILAYASARAEIAGDPQFITAAASDWSPGLHRDDWPEVLAILTRPEVAAAVSSYYRTDIAGGAGSCGIVAAPTLVVHGADDGCIGPALFGGLDEHFAQPLTTIELPGVGHWPHLEAPDATIAAIVGHLRRHA